MYVEAFLFENYKILINVAFLSKKVIFGGGRKSFLPNSVYDFGSNKTGNRVDNRNLIKDWMDIMHKKNKNHKFMWNATDLRGLDPNAYDHVLGI
jgi:alkaline phosphatase